MASTPLIQDRVQTVRLITEELMDSFFAEYQKLYPNESRKDFNKYIALGLAKFELNPLKIRQHAASFEKSQTRIKTLSDLKIKILEGSALTVQALSSSNDVLTDIPWIHISMANRILATVQTICILDDHVTHHIKEQSSKKASKAGKAKHEKYYAPVIEEVYKLVKAHCTNGEKWNSMTQAAKHVKSNAIEASRKSGLEMSDEQAIKTICAWIKMMPDYNKFFQRKKRVENKKKSASRQN